MPDWFSRFRARAQFPALTPLPGNQGIQGGMVVLRRSAHGGQITNMWLGWRMNLRCNVRALTN
jgi:hypothetical protein